MTPRLATLGLVALAAGFLSGPAQGAVAPDPVVGVHAGMRCGECHGPSPDPPVSPVHRTAVGPACGRCHEREREEVAASAHALGPTGEPSDSPTCVSCHGSHRVVRARAGGSLGSADLVRTTCARCHDDPAVIRASRLPSRPVEGYEATFHGRAAAHGIGDVATCTSCHGAHDIQAASGLASPLSAARIQATCRSCHQEVTQAMLAEVRHQDGPPVRGSFLGRLRMYLPVAGAVVNPLLIAGMGALVGFLSGLFGVGGGFLMTPLLIFIGIPAAVAAATDAAQITAGATSGALSHSRLGNVDFKMGFLIVAGGWTGGVAGVQLVHVLRNLGNFDFFLKLTYVLVLGFIGVTMLREGLKAWRGSRGGEPRGSGLTLFFGRLPLQVEFAKSGIKTSVLLPIAAGFLVGVLAAFLGVGGGFIMLPVMIYIIGIPTRVAVGTDLFQIVLTSANVTLQQAITNHTVDLVLAVGLFLGSVLGAQLGVMASRKLRGEQIRVFLALIVLVVMGILLVQLLSPPADPIGFARSGGGH